MLILSLKKHFPARWPEWFMAGLLFAWGAYVALHPALFTNPATATVMSGMALMAGSLPPAAMWGLSATTVGLIRGSALFINGAYTRTPMIRLIMSFASAFIWTQVVVGLIKSGVPNMGLVVYSGLVVMDIVSACRAAVDTVYAEKLRHDIKQGQRQYDNRRSIA
jgi:hypothetical protein